MRVVVQRVIRSSVTVDNKLISEIGKGLNVLLGVLEGDEEKDADFLAEKVVNLRIFEDNDGKMNLSLKDVKGELLIISQFTLYGDCQKGRRPSFVKSEKPQRANLLYEYFIKKCIELADNKVVSGIFGADMKVDILNDGPVTLIIESQN